MDFNQIAAEPVTTGWVNLSSWTQLNAVYGASFGTSGNQAVGHGGGSNDFQGGIDGAAHIVWSGAGTFDPLAQYGEAALLSSSGLHKGYIQAVCVRNSADARAAATDATRDYYAAVLAADGSTHTLTLCKSINGVLTSIAATTTSWTNGWKLRLAAVGAATATDLYVWIEGTLVSALTTLGHSASALATGKPALISSETLNISSFSGGDVSDIVIIPRANVVRAASMPQAVARGSFH